ncbi:DAGAT-domain-containing protein [Aspergillus welwitschiae]|uniref:DAGAT-domain-containing protein n=1 Tax=Aspergillus welwitschiae TaxID=1341132 RepID=A0A3F3QED3_9EURO|nr:DAGAT-domain-containing protein [Aspergillus welwitschiae]RDH37628.1 DAGAT-domain-containing protein [Aspergillus welwitschiae]
MSRHEPSTMDPIAPASSNTVTLRPMPQLEHLWTPEDDWTGVSDRTHRRRLQNRLNQRAYRRKHKVATGNSSSSSSSSSLSPSSSSTQTLIPHSSTIHHHPTTPTPPTSTSDEFDDLHCHLAPHNFHQIRHAFTILATQSYLTNSPRLEHLLSLSRLNVHRAINDNIRILGMTPAWLRPDDALSIFNNNTIITNNPSFLPDVDISTLPESLRPTALQRLVPHHPWLDFFPFPEMRDRLIVAATAGYLDEDELCRDLMAFWDTRNSGATLVVWGVPWDPWNWEVTEAFLAKTDVPHVVLAGCTAELSRLYHKKEDRGGEADKTTELVHHPERMALPIPNVDESGLPTRDHFQTIENASGDTLETVPSPQLPNHFHNIPGFISLQPLLELLIVTLSTNTSILLPMIGYSLLLIPRLRIPILIYLIYIKYLSKAHQSPSPLRSNLLHNHPLWTLYTTYFPISLYRSHPLPPHRKYLFGYHPHGVSIRGAIAAFASNGAGFSSLFPDITNNTLLVSDKTMRAPLLREYALALGINGVSYTSCVNHLARAGQAITICIGGAREARYAKPNTMDLVLNVRRGFVRVAVQTGADLVPVMAFGENELFDVGTVDEVVKGRAWVGWVPRAWYAVTGMKVRWVGGRWGLIVPYRRPVNVVVGRAAVREERGVEDVDDDDGYVEELHGRYVEELRRLWREWRDVFGVERGVRLRIVE